MPKKDHIHKSEAGSFKVWTKNHGFSSTQAAANHVLLNRDKYSPAIVRKANFAKNAAKWKRK